MIIERKIKTVRQQILILGVLIQAFKDLEETDHSAHTKIAIGVLMENLKKELERYPREDIRAISKEVDPFEHLFRAFLAKCPQKSIYKKKS